MKSLLRRRLDRLDAKGLSTAPTVLIEMDLCASQADYEQAFHTAWKKVPDGAVVYCWMRPLSDPEYAAMAEGRLAQPHVMGVYVKPLAPNHLFDTSHDTSL